MFIFFKRVFQSAVMDCVSMFLTFQFASRELVFEHALSALTVLRPEPYGARESGSSSLEGALDQRQAGSSARPGFWTDGPGVQPGLCC